MKITLHNNQDDLPICGDSVVHVVRILSEFLEIETGEIIVHFVSKEQGAKLHGEHFGDPTPTDCMTFPIDPNGLSGEGDILGEVFICPRVAIEYAQNNGDDPYIETTLYLAHTLLHLLGFEDIEESAAKEMRTQENACLAHLSKKNVFISA